jgi:thiamine-phosphate pyrophosphorylase
MKLVVLSPPTAVPREVAVLPALFTAGLEHYHVRKPGWSLADTTAWLRTLPVEWHGRIMLHQHHELVAPLGLAGCHWRDDASAPVHPPTGAGRSSRSCHELAGLRTALGRYDSAFFGPIFPSISKPGYGPPANFDARELTALLSGRTAAERRTTVFALGGVTPDNAARCVGLGFDGVAVLGAIWQATDPVRSFGQLQTALHRHAA